MAKILSGRELADFIKQRQAKQVQSLAALKKITPKLVIIRTNPDPVVDSYMKIKKGYGNDIGIDVEVCDVKQPEAEVKIKQFNEDKNVHGIIVQIPLPDKSKTDQVLNSVTAEKDVDGLAQNSKFDAPTPMAINWLLAGHNIDLKNKHIVIVGHGRLVGRPLKKLFESSNLDVEVADKKIPNLSEITNKADILVSATGVPGLIKNNMVKNGSVVVDAGVSTDSNGLVGDVAKEVRERDDITITPEKGGVGPLTVCALFENVIRSSQEHEN